MSKYIRTESNIVGLVVMKPEYGPSEPLTFAGAATVLAGTRLMRDGTSKKLVPYTTGATEAVAFADYDVVAAGAGDININPLTAAVVRKANIIGTLTAQEEDLLRAQGFRVVDTVENDM